MPRNVAALAVFTLLTGCQPGAAKAPVNDTFTQVSGTRGISSTSSRTLSFTVSMPPSSKRAERWACCGSIPARTFAARCSGDGTATVKGSLPCRNRRSVSRNTGSIRSISPVGT